MCVLALCPLQPGDYIMIHAPFVPLALKSTYEHFIATELNYTLAQAAIKSLLAAPPM